ncbi:unannotated protein [freshwater metagenome]|uniref:Unannotated protein n=1 Tax=freshwater metagenome TaxID=449393 RepID=A0A6J6KV51_9ZZZZ|nr:hypothetical protein [Actinomycetota bacterium]MSZ90416.1 hypothetical protein [Actinomycetota bacterium]
MESLALLVAILMGIAFFSGPIAIALTKLNSSNFIITLIRRMFHGFFVAMSFWVGMMFAFNPGVPFVVHLIGFYGLVMGYIASRREYFPDVRIIAPLLARLGLKGFAPRQITGDSTQGESGSGDSSSRHGPVIKWRRDGRSGGNDGHGPGGQH